MVAFSFEGWSPEVGMTSVLQSATADCSWSCASFLHPTASASHNQSRSCVTWTRVKFFLVWVSIFSGRLCWCLRTYALWNRRRWLIVLGLPAIIVESAVILTSYTKISYIPIPTGIQQVCMASPGVALLSVLAWIVPFSFDTVMTLLSIVRAMRVSRKLKTALTTQLIRDGAKTCSCATMTMSDYLAGFGYYGYTPLWYGYFQVSLTASQADDKHLRYGPGFIFGVCHICS